MSRSLSSLTRSFRSLSTAPSCSSALSRRSMASTAEPTPSTPAVVEPSSSDPPAPGSSPSDTDIDAPAESSTPQRTPYSYPYHLPHQYEDVYHPTVVEGRETRRVHDTTTPEEGAFTAENAWLSSIPIAVRRRLAYKLDRLPVGESLDILPPTTLKHWWKDRIEGRLPTNPLTPEAVRESQTEYLKAKFERRTRIRGQITHTDRDTGETVNEIVGQRIYLPNIVFKLVRNTTDFIRGPGGHPIGREPYNPFVATFRIPKSTTKQDVKSYLKAVYNLDTTFVRTDVRNAPVTRARTGQLIKKDSFFNYKRAVVGLTEPFHYPDDIDEMDREEREIEKKRLEFDFSIERRKETHKRNLVANRDEKGSSKSRPGASGKLSVILARTAARRDQVEQSLREQAQMSRERRHNEDNP